MSGRTGIYAILRELAAVRKEKEEAELEVERLHNQPDTANRKKEWTSPAELDPSEFANFPILVKIQEDGGQRRFKYGIRYFSSPDDKRRFRDDVASGLIVEWAPLFDFLKR